MNLDDALSLGRLDAHDQAALAKSGEVSAAELTEAAILRIEALDPALGAVSARGFDLALDRAAHPVGDGPMAGVPYLLKDSLDYPGLPGRGGSRARTDVSAVRSFAFTDRFDAQGLVPLGKSNMPEFGLLPTTEPLLGPITRNPWADGVSPGGSSGGAGAALAAGLVPLAHGSDGAGSIRIPASCCGVVGLKPGRDATVRVRARSVIEDLIVGDSLMSRSVRDVAWAFAATHPDTRRTTVTAPSSRRLRIGLCFDALGGAPPDPAVVRATEAAAQLCESLGHQVERATPDFDRMAAAKAMRTLWIHDAADAVDAVRAEGRAHLLEPWTLALDEQAAALPVSALEAAMRQVAEVPRRLSTWYADHDVMLTPTLAAPPPPIGFMQSELSPDLLMARMFDWLGYTSLQNLSGTPAISLPLAWSDGLPIGVMFAADRGHEDTLLALALELEAVQSWGHRWPDLTAKDA